MKWPLISLGAVAALAAAFFIFAEPAVTQNPSANAGFPEEKIEAFVNAAIDIAIINTAAKDAFDKSTNPQEQNAIIAAARAEMDNVITNAPNITMDEYIAISTAAESDPAFAEELNNRALEKFKLLDEAHQNLDEGSEPGPETQEAE